jgi:ABC-type multidrug transport system fused ATPase/permease subunit
VAYEKWHTKRILAAEAAINATLERLGRERTVVTVTHRLASVVGADRIVVLSHGEIVEEGTHDELLRRSGRYRALLALESEAA